MCKKFSEVSVKMKKRIKKGSSYFERPELYSDSPDRLRKKAVPKKRKKVMLDKIRVIDPEELDELDVDDYED